MDGHDNNTDEDNRSSSAQGVSSVSDVSGARGIYSTPDLTIDADKISPSSSNARSRITSFFANTEAGQRSQKLNDAMELSAQTQPSQPVTEDVVINNAEPRKRSKKPLVIALIILAMIGVGVGAYALIHSLTANTQISQKEAFNDYFEYLKNGPDGGRAAMTVEGFSGDTWYFVTVGGLNISEAAKSEYYHNLSEKFETFRKLVDTSNSGDTLKTEVNISNEILKYAILVNTITDVDNSILELYLRDGAEAAYAYVESITTNNTNIGLISHTSQQLKTYFDKELSIIQMYESGGCYSGVQINYPCQNKIAASNMTFEQTSSEQQSILENLRYSATNLQQALQTRTVQIQEALGN